MIALRPTVSWSILTLALALAVAPAPLAAQALARVSASTLTLPRTAPVLGFTTTRAFGNLSFDQPVAVVSPPGETDRLFVVEKEGRILVVHDLDATSPTTSVFLDIRTRVGNSAGEQGLLALAFHPGFATNGFFYVWYTLNTTTDAGSGRHNRLARFAVSSSNPNAANPDSELPLITQRDEASNHNGGEILFGPDGYLYLSLGDEGGAGDQYRNGQRIDRDFFASILRIDVDQRPGSIAPNPHAAVHPGTYSIPPDNPFIGASTFNGSAVEPSSVRTEMWTIGMRNPWRMSFDSATGELWVGDVGQNTYEEIDIAQRGGNFGWPYREGFNGYSGTPPAGTTLVEPIHAYSHTLGESITGGIVYRGSRLSQLYGAYLFADYGSGRIWSLRRVEGDAPQVQQLTVDPGIVSFGLNPQTGDVLLVDIAEGAIMQLVYTNTPTGAALPETLSATGAFSDLATLTPQPGVVPYEPNVSFWSDHATKRRWFALRDTSSTFGFSNEGNWSLPDTAVWVKHFDLELTRGDPATARRIETRFLVKTPDGVYGATYRWNDAQTDATLVPEEGVDEDFTVVENGVPRTQTWRYPGRAECLTCHTPQGGYALSFNTRQLNRAHAFPGGESNQLEALAGAGYFPEPIPPATALVALAAADDLTATLRQRARAYLDVNCAPCHQPGGAALGMWDARIRTPLTIAAILDGPLVDDAGDDDNRVIAPGDAGHSQLLQRIRGFTTPRMPPLATRERDLAGEALLEDWIESLAGLAREPRVVNLSGRGHVGTGNDVLIPSFVIDAGSPRTVLVRAIGPTLGMFGVTGALAEPVLTVFAGSQPIATNSRWSSAPNATDIAQAAAAVGAFPLPVDAADSALLLTLDPGAYTAQTAGINATTGEALVEVYDTQPTTSGGRLANTAMRARINGGDDLLIPGLVIREGEPIHVLARAVGPGLAAMGISPIVGQPRLRLFRGSSEVASNLGWNTAANVDAIRSSAEVVGAFAIEENSGDSALLTQLPPGAYTLHVGAADGSSGIVLVEVYELP